MKIIWITKRVTNNGTSGEEIYDRKLIAACQKINSMIDLFHPEPVGRIGEVRNMMLGSPYQRARYSASANTRKLHEVIARHNYDFAVCSWEPFDALGRSLAIPSVLITHNISSLALPGIFPGNSLAKIVALRARMWERTSYTPNHFYAVGALSRSDLAYLKSINAPRPTWLPPGMPPFVPLRIDAGFRPDIVISGTFLWGPKRRGIMEFATEYQTSGVIYPILADGLPDEAAAILKPKALPNNADAIRVGIVTDRFDAGHKLKTLAYIADNQIVMSFANVSFDFNDIPDNEFFIRRVTSVADVAKQMQELAAIPPDILRTRFLAFQQDCARRFTWDLPARTLMDIGESIMNRVKVVA